MNNSKWKKIQKDLLIVLFSAVTEVWDFESGENEIIQPTLPSEDYAYGMTLLKVDAYFCSIWF